MIDVIIEPRGFLAFDVFDQILKSRLVDFKMIDSREEAKDRILTSNHFLCSESFEKEIGGHAQGSTKFEISNRIMFMDPLDIDFDFGILGFSDLGYLTKMNTLHNQEHLYV